MARRAEKEVEQRDPEDSDEEPFESDNRDIPYKPAFPDDVFPPMITEYIGLWAKAIYCPVELIAVPLLAVAGAAIGLAKRKAVLHESRTASSCLWAVCLCRSGSGKTPALKAVMNFYRTHDEALQEQYEQDLEKWKKAKAQAKAKGEFDEPEPERVYTLLSNTTTESLTVDLATGPVLFARDELSAWTHQMGQYKQGAGGDRAEWLSFWSHDSVNVGRKTTDRVYLKDPFVAVAGMMVPSSVADLIHKGKADDGFVHRMLVCHPDPYHPYDTGLEVPLEKQEQFDHTMTRLFEPTVEEVHFTDEARYTFRDWKNRHLFYELKGCELTDKPEAPDWMVEKASKLEENCLRVALVLHELWRVCTTERRAALEEIGEAYTRRAYGQDHPWDDDQIDLVDLWHAERVIEYFRLHAHFVHKQMMENVKQGTGTKTHRIELVDKRGNITTKEADEVDTEFVLVQENITTGNYGETFTYDQFKRRRKKYNSGLGRRRAMKLWKQWEERGYGTVGKEGKSVAFTVAKRNPG